MKRSPLVLNTPYKFNLLIPPGISHQLINSGPGIYKIRSELTKKVLGNLKVRYLGHSESGLLAGLSEWINENSNVKFDKYTFKEWISKGYTPSIEGIITKDDVNIIELGMWFNLKQI